MNIFFYVKNNKKLIVILIVLILLLASGFFLRSYKKVDESDGIYIKNLDVLYWNVSYVPRYFYPNMNLSETEKQLVNNLYEGLTRVEDNEIVYGMAKTIDISDNKLEYTIELRTAQWSDGVIVKSEDFLNSWKRDENYWNRLNILYYEAFIDYVEIVDSRTLKIVLESPNENLLYQLSTVAFMPVRNDIVDVNKKLPQQVGNITNGAYVVNSVSVFGGIELKKNIHYYNYYDVMIDTILIIYETNFKKVYDMYLDSQLDVVFSVDNENITSLFKNEDDFKLFRKYGTYNFIINSEVEELSLVWVRELLNLGIDRNYINPFVDIDSTSTIASIFHNTIDFDDVMETSEDLNHLIERSNYIDQTRINNIFEATNSKSLKELTGLELITLNNPNDIDIAIKLVNSWKDNLGILVKIRVKDMYDYNYALKSKSYDIILNNYSSSDMSIRQKLKYFLNNFSTNYTSFADDYYDTKLSSTVKKHENINFDYGKLLNRVAISRVNIPLFSIYDPVIISPNIVGWTRSYESLLYFGRAVKLENKEEN